jgi:hypothetical protein
MMKVSEYMNEDNKRMAKIWVDLGINFVYCYEDKELTRVINCVGHSMQYAEDAAENWVSKIGAFTV